MENKYTNTNTEANNTAENKETPRKDFGEMLARVLFGTPMAVGYAHSIIKDASEASERHCKSQFGKAIPAPLRVDSVCEAVIAMFKDPDCFINKDEFLRGVVAFMLASQMKDDIEKQTGKTFSEAFADTLKSSKKEESNG